MYDPDGNWPKWSNIFAVIAVVAVVVVAVAATVVTYGAAAPALVAAGGSLVTAGAAATAASVATTAAVVATVSATAAVVANEIEKSADQTSKNNNSVYVLVDDAGAVQYVGRTVNVKKREAAHRANPFRHGLRMDVLESGLSLKQARALEQAGMAYYHTINSANKMNNQINGVAPKYWGVYKPIALNALKYGWNKMTNEILYWTGN